MVRQPKDLAEAKQIIKEERIKITSSISAIAGSRWLMAILATFALAFGTHLLYAPARLPPVSGLSIAQIGLPTGVDFGFVGEQAKEAARAASDQDVGGRVQEAVAANQERIPLINAIGFGLALVLLAINMTIMTKRRRTTRG
ncbi:MAG TPA: hypothetical protein VFO00_12315 [Vitreimonas sp.]|nr:hypothetical protein [Vitreimonas sp.]